MCDFFSFKRYSIKTVDNNNVIFFSVLNLCNYMKETRHWKSLIRILKTHTVYQLLEYCVGQYFELSPKWPPIHTIYSNPWLPTIWSLYRLLLNTYFILWNNLCIVLQHALPIQEWLSLSNWTFGSRTIVYVADTSIGS